MMALVAAISLAVAVYLGVTLHLVAPPASPPGRPAARPARPPAWSVTDRARELVGWSRRQWQVASWVSAGVVGWGMALLVQDPLVVLPYGWIGYQVPSLYLELRAARDLARLQRQISVFVGAVHDHLHARGATVEDALVAAAEAVGPGPMTPALDQYRRAVEAGWPLRERLAALDRAVNWPSLRFFLALLALRDETGTRSMAQAFDSLQEKLQDDERIQALIRGELSVHLLVLGISLALVVGIWPYYRLMSPNWPLYHQHLSLLVTLAGFAAAVVFHGVHRFTRAQLAATD